MKVAFLHYDLRDRIGVMILSAELKKKGHITDVFTFFDTELISQILSFNPEILALSSSTTEHKYLYRVAKEIKEKSKYTIIMLGGPHGTFFPEEIFRNDFLDIICIGEGDKAVIELCDKVEQGEDFSKIPNLWVRKGNDIHQSDLKA